MYSGSFRTCLELFCRVRQFVCRNSIEAPFTSLPLYPLPNFPNYTAAGRSAAARASPHPRSAEDDDAYGGADGTFAASRRALALDADDRHARPISTRATEWVGPSAPPRPCSGLPSRSVSHHPPPIPSRVSHKTLPA